MHILVATGLYPPESGGPATYSRLLEEELPLRGVAVTVVPFALVRKFPPGIRHVLYALKLVVSGKRVTHVLALDPVSVGFPAWMASVFRGKPFFVKVVGDYAWEQGVQRFGVPELLDDFLQKDDYGFFVMTLRYIQTFVARRARCVIVPSEYLRGVVEQWGIKKSTIVVVPNAAPRVARAGKKTLRAILNYHELIVVTIGRLVPWKGVEGLIRATARAASSLPQFKLVVIGSGPELERLEKQAQASSIASNVVFTGHLPHDVTMRYLEAADVCVLNTGYEGFSHLILESLALGTPVITTSVGGNREMIQNEKNGILVPYNKIAPLSRAIAALGGNASLRNTLARAGEESAKLYTPERTVRGLLDALSV